jgi:predicted amidohydrolase
MRFHAIQTNPIWEQPLPNRAEITRALQECLPQPGDFVVLPELCETGFTMRSNLAATSDSAEWGAGVAKSHKIWLQCGLARRQPDGGIANTATIFSPDGSEVVQYRKCFLFTPGGEDRSYSPGSGPVVFDCGGVKIAPMICYDLRFPELWRHALLCGAEIFTLSACWPALRLRQMHAMLASRAIENQSWVIAANRTGHEPSTQYSGGSTIVDFLGETKALCASDPSFISHEIDVDELRTFRAKFKVISDIQRKFLGSSNFV